MYIHINYFLYYLSICTYLSFRNKNEQKYPKGYVFLNHFFTVFLLAQSRKAYKNRFLGHNQFLNILP